MKKGYEGERPGADAGSPDPRSFPYPLVLAPCGAGRRLRGSSALPRRPSAFEFLPSPGAAAASPFETALRASSGRGHEIGAIPPGAWPGASCR